MRDSDSSCDGPLGLPLWAWNFITWILTGALIQYWALLDSEIADERAECKRLCDLYTSEMSRQRQKRQEIQRLEDELADVREDREWWRKLANKLRSEQQSQRQNQPWSVPYHTNHYPNVTGTFTSAGTSAYRYGSDESYTQNFNNNNRRGGRRRKPPPPNPSPRPPASSMPNRTARVGQPRGALEYGPLYSYTQGPHRLYAPPHVPSIDYPDDAEASSAEIVYDGYPMPHVVARLRALGVFMRPMLTDDGEVVWIEE